MSINHNHNRFIEKTGASIEEKLEIWYSFSLEKPKPTMSIPQDEWISTIK